MQDSDRVAIHLADSAVWQRHLRQAATRNWFWEGMAAQPLPEDLQTTEGFKCNITHEPFAALEQPVLAQVEGMWRVYEASALLTYWVEHGKDGLNQPLDFMPLRRPPLPTSTSTDDTQA